jgi:hypothetical protein
MMFDWRDYTPLGKRSTYGGHLRHRHDGDLDKATALHWLLHDSRGAALLDRVDLPAKDVADLLVRAAAMKRNEVSKMESTTRILKNVRSMGEAEYTRIVTNYAKQQYPELTRERAFAKVFEAPDGEGRAIRTAWLIAKGGSIASGPLDADEAGDEGRGVVADALDDEADALAELERLTVEVRRRDPSLTKAQAFAKVYQDPDNARLAQRERMQNRPRA